MSILLNAINKSKQDQDESSHDDDSVDSEIEELIESPMDEYPSDDGRQSIVLNGNKTIQLITVLLGIIAVSLLVIVTLLVLQQIEKDNVSSEQLVNASETKPEDVSIGKPLAQPLAQQGNSQVQQSNPSSTEITESATSSAESSLTNSSDTTSYFESYQAPKKVAPAKKSLVTKKSNNTRRETVRASTKPTEQSKSAEASSQVSFDIPKTLDQLSPENLLSVQQVRVDAHVYSKDVSKSFVFINGSLKQTGDVLIDGWSLDRIDEDSIVISKGSLKVRKENQK